MGAKSLHDFGHKSIREEGHKIVGSMHALLRSSNLFHVISVFVPDSNAPELELRVRSRYFYMIFIGNLLLHHQRGNITFDFVSIRCEAV